MSLDGFVQLIFNVYEAYTVGLFVQNKDSLSCISAISFAGSFDKARSVPIDGTLPGWAVKHKEALIIGNFDKDEATLGYYGKKEEIKSFMAYPLDTPGIIVIDSKKKWVFTDKEKKILGHFVAVLTKEVEREKRLQEMEEERDELSVTRRLIGFLRDARPDVSVVEEILNEGLALSGADLAVAAIEKRGFLRILGAKGLKASELDGVDCPAQGTIASTVLEGAMEFVLPYESGYLREKPVFFPNDGIRARQYFGFPLVMDEKPFGFLGFLSLTQNKLKEGSIMILREMGILSSLYLARLKIQDEMDIRSDKDPVTGARRFRAFFETIAGMVAKKKDFSIVSIKLVDFDTYNRSVGVARADEILTNMHQGIVYCVGKDAIVTRSYGGHFYVAVNGPDMREGHDMFRVLKYTILKAVSGQVTPARDLIQIGTAYFPRDGQDVWVLLATAEERGKQNTA